jgi:ribonuclease T2
VGLTPANTPRLQCEQGPKAPELEDLFVFFETTISFYRELPTWKWLSCAGINPSNSTAYSIADIQDALIKGFGAAPYVGCSGPKYNETEEGQGSTDAGRTVLTEVWYYHHVRGAPQLNDGVRVPADIQGGSLGNCAKADNAVWYYQRTNGSEW